MFYGFGETTKNILAYIYTKVMWKKARLVRLPIYARTKKNIHISNGFTTGYSCRISASKYGVITFGENVIIGDNVQIECVNRIDIGNNVLMASRIFIGDSNHGIYSGDNQSAPSNPPNERPIEKGEVIIEDNVWIGNGVSIVGSIKIGFGTIIGANSVVTKNLDSKSIYVGCPAVKIKEWDENKEEWVLVE